ncbi:phosphoenolpyruvate carboxylase [Vulcanisaeta souniana]|uniref:phosphoenolpyruvate carboxylase n=1 Tax=Vulcanisaeta souniana TaxID=164452 RepID=UPI001FB42484|nr:phosphoenolpyruvate carboxylase [Vulcanisaeta souniana]
MCTQHPDNAQIPNWSRDGVIQGDDEIHEAYLATVYMVATRSCGTSRVRMWIYTWSENY